MSMFAAWIVYPLVLLALCTGLGLLVDALSGRRLPGALIPPLGLVAMIVIGQFTTYSDATAELTVPVLVLLAAVGAALAFPWRFNSLDPWPMVVALAVFAVFAAPVVLSGEPTFAGYIKLDDTATWLAFTDRVMEHGTDIEGLAPSSYQRTLEVNFTQGYPVGVFVPFGTSQKLVGGDLAWVFQPYMAFLAAMLALALWEIAGGALRHPTLRALAVFVAAQPALLFAYSLWGGVKEVAAAALIALAAAVAPAAIRTGASVRDAIPLAVASGGLVGVLSPSGMVWLAPMLAVLMGLAVRRFGTREALLRAAAFALVLSVLFLPLVVGGIFSPFEQSWLTKETELGNLIEALNPIQALGIWPTGDFRVDPDATVLSVVLIVFGIAAAAVGLVAAWQRGSIALLLYAGSLIACVALVAVGSPWVGGKALATVSPMVLLLAIVGAASVLALDRVSGSVLLIAVAGGVLWSNALAYRDVQLAPYDQLVELEQIGEDFAGQGPALMTEYHPYGARHFLRELDGEGASELRANPVPLKDGKTAEKGEAVDVDELDLEGLFFYRTLVLRRSPTRSRPPAAYRLVRRGETYEVWQRPAVGAPIPQHLSLGGPGNPGDVPDCGEVSGLGLFALSKGATNVQIVAARAASVLDATSGELYVPLDDDYAAWLQGSFGGQVELFVDERLIGTARHQLNNEGGFTQLGEARLAAGSHRVELRFKGADLHPGSGVPPEVSPLLFVPTEEDVDELVSVDIAHAERLCGERWDWIEAVQP
ncbi:MAG TPA: hypothetical protein VIE64_02540 [Solirubrobacterales bacterium]|jgi:hypothetical protein